MENLIKENAKLIYYIISKFPPGYDKDDLFQVGCIGLIKAYRNYNSSFNTKFSSYAYNYILGEIAKYIKEDKNIKVNPDIINLNKSIIRAKELLTQRLGKEPNLHELSIYLEIDEQKLVDAITCNERVKRLDLELDEDYSLYNSIKVEEKGYKAELIDLRNELDKLTDEEKRLIEARYFANLTQKETSSNLGMSQVQVSRKETKILLKLRDKLVA